MATVNVTVTVPVSMIRRNFSPRPFSFSLSLLSPYLLSKLGFVEMKQEEAAQLCLLLHRQIDGWMDLLAE